MEIKYDNFYIRFINGHKCDNNEILIGCTFGNY